MFNDLIEQTGRQQLQLLGALPAKFYGEMRSENTLALIDYDVETLAADGQNIISDVVISMPKTDVGLPRRGDVIRVCPVGTQRAQDFTVGEVYRDDGYIVEMFVRG